MIPHFLEYNKTSNKFLNLRFDLCQQNWWMASLINLFGSRFEQKTCIQ